jgi:hypothetical protein
MLRLAPLHKVLLAGLAFRMVAVFFSTGYLMHDDHFLVVEAAASWADGEDYNRWLPWNQEVDQIQAHPANFAYVGTQFLLFKALDFAGIVQPQSQMLVVRFLHALFSLLIIVLGHRLAVRLGADQKTALLVAWILAVGGLFPNLAVRNLVEMVCIPPLLWGLAAAVKSEKLDLRSVLVAGVGIGIATGLRYQCGLFGLGLGGVLLVQRQWREAVQIGVVALATFAVMQSADLLVWGEPFVQLRAYLNYNGTHAGEYPTGPWYIYLLTIGGLLIPPVSLLILFGFFAGFFAGSCVRNANSDAPKHLRWWRVAVPTLLFLVFHSVYVNKQERFILPAIPALVALGLYGWSLWRARSAWWSGRAVFERWIWRAFWGLNTVALLAFTIIPGKSSRVGAMDYMYAQGAENFLVVQVDAAPMMPRFYAGTWAEYYWSDRRTPAENPHATDIIVQRNMICRGEEGRPWPAYFLFVGDAGLAHEINGYKQMYPGLKYETTIRPEWYDRWINRINPINGVERIIIYSADREKICSPSP